MRFSKRYEVTLPLDRIEPCNVDLQEFCSKYFKYISKVLKNVPFSRFSGLTSKPKGVILIENLQKGQNL